MPTNIITKMIAGYEAQFMRNVRNGNSLKRLLLAWDPDFTKLTKEEELSLENAENSGFIDDSSIDWDNLSQIA